MNKLSLFSIIMATFLLLVTFLVVIEKIYVHQGLPDDVCVCIGLAAISCFYLTWAFIADHIGNNNHKH